MVQPAYAFTLPSIYDGLPLDGRIYHPKHLDTDIDCRSPSRGAVIAHPYAPLGGCYDDAVVLAVAETLLEQGYVVCTFNFRGALGSQGRTSWTGRAEQEDYVSFIGCMLFYMDQLRSEDGHEPRPPFPPVDTFTHRTNEESSHRSDAAQLLLAGYSYGSLILARLPPVLDIQARFASAASGTSAAEILLRARTLAEKTRETIDDEKLSRGRQSSIPSLSTIHSKRHGSSPITLGGPQSQAPTSLSDAPPSRRESSIRALGLHLRRHSSGRSRRSQRSATSSNPDPPIATQPLTRPIMVRYLLVSPVLLPLTQTLLPPGAPLGMPALGAGRKLGGSERDAALLGRPTLALFGSADGFSSPQRLAGWARQQAVAAAAAVAGGEDDGGGGVFEWEMVPGAGHFWREQGAMRALQRRVAVFVSTVSTYRGAGRAVDA